MKLTKNANGNTFLLIAAVLSGVCALQEVNYLLSYICYREIIRIFTWSDLIAPAVMICLTVVLVLILLGKRSLQWLGLPLSLYWASDVVNYLTAFNSQYQYDTVGAFITLFAAALPLGFLIVTVLTVRGKISTIIPVFVFFSLNLLKSFFVLLVNLGNEFSLSYFIWAAALFLAVLAVTPAPKRKKRLSFSEEPIQPAQQDYWRDGFADYVSAEETAEQAESKEPTDGM